MKTVWRVFAYLKRYPLLATGTLTCAVLGTFMVIVFPAVTKWIINDVVRMNHPEKLLPLVLLAAAAFLLQHAFNAVRIVRSAQRFVFSYSVAAASLVRQSGHGRSDDAGDRGCELRRARAD